MWRMSDGHCIKCGRAIADAADLDALRFGDMTPDTRDDLCWSGGRLSDCAADGDAALRAWAATVEACEWRGRAVSVAGCLAAVRAEQEDGSNNG